MKLYIFDIILYFAWCIFVCAVLNFLGFTGNLLLCLEYWFSCWVVWGLLCLTGG